MGRRSWLLAGGEPCAEGALPDPLEGEVSAAEGIDCLTENFSGGCTHECLPVGADGDEFPRMHALQRLAVSIVEVLIALGSILKPFLESGHSRTRLPLLLNYYRMGRERARRFTRISRYIATIQVPLDGRFRFERTTRTEGHYTLWGSPTELISCVLSIGPV